MFFKNKKALVAGLLLVLFLFFESMLCSAACTSLNTPRIKLVESFELAEDALFEHDFEIYNLPEENVSYALVFLDKKLTGISIDDNGILSFIPSSDDVGVSRIGVVAVKDFCAYTLVITLYIYSRPDIISFNPKNTSIMMNQTQSVSFSVKAVDDDSDERLSYVWFIDSDPIIEALNKTSYSFKPGYELSGLYNISVVVTNFQGLSAIKQWDVLVAKINRPPVLVYEVPGFVVFKNTGATAYNLNDYFVDPDGGNFVFEYASVKPDYEVKELVYANISVDLSEDGHVTYTPSFNTKGYAYFVFTASDAFGKSTDSNIVKVDVVGVDQVGTLNTTSLSNYCGDYVCGALEDCNTCPFDCGKCEQDQQIGCKPEWNCSEWSVCLPGGLMKRECDDLNLCDDNRSKPDEVVGCEYNASCDDGLKNGIEEGVDCGGVCDPCPRCNDSVQNQGEEGVDCGGPCENMCPSCFDELKNQDESDVDCGGQCKDCVGGMSCLKNMDCESLRCEYLICTHPSCDDEIRNQGELGIDCGGPCAKPCGNCSDEIMNGGEKGVDCGGKCKPCPACDDGLKNGNEGLVDCGGDCENCAFNDYFKAYFAWFIILFIIIALLPISIIGYLFFILLKPEKARALYDNSSGFAFIVEINRFFRTYRKIRKHIPLINEDIAKSFINHLAEISKAPDLKDMLLHEEISKIFTSILGLPSEFDKNIFNMMLRASNMPLFLKILFGGYYKKADILLEGTFVPMEQKQDMITELKFLLAELSKG